MKRTLIFTHLRHTTSEHDRKSFLKADTFMRMLLLSCTWFKNILFSLEELLQVLCWELDLPSALPSQSSQKEVKTQLLPVVFLSIIGSLIIVIIGSLFFIFVSCDAFPVDFPPLSLMYGTILLNTDPSYSQHLPSAWVFR